MPPSQTVSRVSHLPMLPTPHVAQDTHERAILLPGGGSGSVDEPDPRVCPRYNLRSLMDVFEGLLLANKHLRKELFLFLNTNVEDTRCGVEGRGGVGGGGVGDTVVGLGCASSQGLKVGQDTKTHREPTGAEAGAAATGLKQGLGESTFGRSGGQRAPGWRGIIQITQNRVPAAQGPLQ